MTTARTDQSASRPGLRLWPGVLFAGLLLAGRFGLPLVMPEAGMFGVIGGIFGALAIVLWWVFFSRAPWSERLGAIVFMIAALFATSYVVHESVANGMMGMMLPILGIPVLSIALVTAVVATRRYSSWSRRASIAVAVLLACGLFTALRTGGISGAGESDLHWRWTPSPEERLLSSSRDDRVPSPPAPANVTSPETSATAVSADTPAPPTAAESSDKRSDVRAGEGATPHATSTAIHTPAEWPGFRGPNRDSIVSGVRIETDWSQSPPVQMWRRPIGPGWSSFAVRGDLLYTQEQRGDDEIVGCYRVLTGEPVWRHRDPARFWESNGGAGPRGTPTIENNRVYAFGATGILNALDATNGSVVWSRDVASETNTEVPGWGFASSPLVIDDIVVVAADATLVAYDRTTGQRRWIGPVHHGSYSSPHRTTIDGVDQILLLGGAGATSVAPGNGTVLWEYSWPGTAIVQPALLADGNLLINKLAATGGLGTRRLAIGNGPGGWTAEERWTSSGLKPYFNDFVIHKGYAFGFDGSILSSINLEDGGRMWKGGRYGNGQIMLLPDQDLLLVLSEEGELALVSATPDQFKELGRFPALAGKTWNHPALIGDILLVRNGEEMAAFRLALANH
jgi:outer membrane protein assembly factor BamB